MREPSQQQFEEAAEALWLADPPCNKGWTLWGHLAESARVRYRNFAHVVWSHLSRAAVEEPVPPKPRFNVGDLVQVIAHGNSLYGAQVAIKSGPYSWGSYEVATISGATTCMFDEWDLAPLATSSRFKAGDRVRVVNANAYENHSFLIGQQATVIEIVGSRRPVTDPPPLLRIKMDGPGGLEIFAYESMLEVVPRFRAAQFRPGDRVVVGQYVGLIAGWDTGEVGFVKCVAYFGEMVTVTFGIGVERVYRADQLIPRFSDSERPLPTSAPYVGPLTINDHGRKGWVVEYGLSNALTRKKMWFVSYDGHDAIDQRAWDTEEAAIAAILKARREYQERHR